MYNFAPVEVGGACVWLGAEGSLISVGRILEGSVRMVTTYVFVHGDYRRVSTRRLTYCS